MSNEKDTFNNHEQGYDAERLKDLGTERQKELAAERERNAAEKGPEANVEKARHEALEQASRAEHEAKKYEKRTDSPAERRGAITKRERDASYNATMHEVRSQMSGPARAFSSVIHNPTVERVSDMVGGTVARPNAVLSGSVIAFLLTLAIYLIARFNGYPLSGTETIASFILGWILGMVFDYFRLIITGKK